jgi:predicted RecB family nuclease
MVAETEAALTGVAPAIYEAAFQVEDSLLFTDILLRTGSSWTLIEVKSATSVGEDHVLDAAFQTYLLRAAGVEVTRVDVMHLNRECRYPDLKTLFLRVDVTDGVTALLPRVAEEVPTLRRTLAGPLPNIDTGDHCTTPRACPFKARCWPPLPDHHVSTLYRVHKKKVQEYVAAGYHTIPDLPETMKLSATAARQRRAVREGTVVVERDALMLALQTLTPPVAHLDFETVQLAVPRWPGCRPYDQVPVQVSCHVVDVDGTVTHHAWLADGPDDPRPVAAAAVLNACRGARTVTAYFAAFEQSRLRELAEACPALAADLLSLADAIVDLLPVVRDHVYHPAFGGSFSLKKVLPALVPSLRYDDLVIREGETASVELSRMLFEMTASTAEEREELREMLLAYCERDTEAMVALTARLMELCA